MSGCHNPETKEDLYKFQYESYGDKLINLKNELQGLCSANQSKLIDAINQILIRLDKLECNNNKISVCPHCSGTGIR